MAGTIGTDQRKDPEWIAATPGGPRQYIKGVSPQYTDTGEGVITDSVFPIAVGVRNPDDSITVQLDSLAQAARAYIFGRELDAAGVKYSVLVHQGNMDKIKERFEQIIDFAGGG